MSRVDLNWVVMSGLVPGIHVFVSIVAREDVDGRDKPGHDEEYRLSSQSGTQPCVSTRSSITSASIPALRKVTIASVGVQTIGSLSLKEVLTTIGTPVCS